jgi:hypothetical protein
MKFDKGTMATILTAGIPVAAGGIGAYMASRNHQKNQQRQQENLRAVGRDILTNASFGKALPAAQERFIELAALAPRAMQQRSLAAPLLLAAVGNREDFSSVAQRATTIERNLSVTGATSNTHQAFTLGVQLGDKLSPMVLDMAKLNPPISSVSAGDIRFVAMQSLMADDSRPIQKRLPSYFQSQEGQAELVSKAQDLASDPNILKSVTESHLRTSPTYQSLENIESAAHKGSTKKAAIDLSKTASAEAAGEILATQYLMIKAASDMHKLSFEFSKAFKDALMYAGTAALGAAASVGIDKSIDAWKGHKMQGQLDASFDTAFKRVQKGNAEDRFAEEVRVKLESDPLRYRQMAREAFDVLAETSPHMAKHPIVARSFINSVITNDGAMPSQDLSTFSKIQDSVFMPKPLSERMLPAFRAFGGETAISSAVQDVVRTPWRETERQWRLEDADAAEHNRHVHARELLDLRRRADFVAQKRQETAMAQRDVSARMHGSAQDAASRQHAIDLEKLKDNLRLKTQKKIEKYKAGL